MTTKKVTIYFPFWVSPIRDGLSKKPSLTKNLCFHIRSLLLRLITLP